MRFCPKKMIQEICISLRQWCRKLTTRHHGVILLISKAHFILFRVYTPTYVGSFQYTDDLCLFLTAYTRYYSFPLWNKTKFYCLLDILMSTIAAISSFYFDWKNIAAFSHFIHFAWYILYYSQCFIWKTNIQIVSTRINLVQYTYGSFLPFSYFVQFNDELL